MRKAADSSHINVAELDAVLRGVNLALKWSLKTLEVITDSVTVHGWINSVIKLDCRVKTRGSAEMLIKRRLSNLSEIISEFGLTVSVTLVRSEENRADVLTRVKKSWLDAVRSSESEPSKISYDETCAAGIAELHSKHHFGVDRTLYLARMTNPDTLRSDVKKCVQACRQCQRIDPAPKRHESGSLNVTENWSRLAIDVTHYQGKNYLTLVDCGPSRFSIWRQIPSESAAEIVRVLEELFRERGPVSELLMDNGTAFRSSALADLCQRWNVRRHYRAAHRPSGNGIVERVHRTIKRTAERSGCSPLQAVFWYNIAPKDGIHGQSVPSSSLYRYKWRHPSEEPVKEKGAGISNVQNGDLVWVKPPKAKCTSRWKLGRVTKVVSNNNVEVNGIPRHILDIRAFVEEEEDASRSGASTRTTRALREVEESGDGGDDDDGEGEDDGESEDDSEAEDNSEGEDGGEGGGRPVRERRAPVWFRDYVT